MTDYLTASLDDQSDALSMHVSTDRDQVTMTIGKNPFEATGYIVTRLDDGRFLISFSRPENYMGRDRLLTHYVILSTSDFNAFVSVMIPTTPKKEEGR